LTAAQKAVRVNFARSAHQATKIGVIKGYATVKYVFRVKIGQHVSVKLKSANPSMFFVFNESDEEYTEWDGNVRENGDYSLIVFLMRSEARRGHSANYSLTVRAE
jgi:hypothetical protein